MQLVEVEEDSYTPVEVEVDSSHFGFDFDCSFDFNSIDVHKNIEDR